MTKQKVTMVKFLGTYHIDSIKRVRVVPKAAKGHFNTTPGTKEPPIITAGREPTK